VSVNPDVVDAWRYGLEDDIIEPGPLGFSATLAREVVAMTGRAEVRVAWCRREREAWAARVLAGIDAARRATPVTVAEIRARNGWRTSWEVVVPAKAQPRRAPRTRC
jgi:hypothetical protein